MAWSGAGVVKEIVVYRSVSYDVFANLAFEDWIFKNVNLSCRRILFLWRNFPSVVIGRHQNPWKEVDLRLLKDRGVEIARRRSGGGTVYHDLGNINFTIFSSRLDYNRPRNLKLVCDSVNQKWNLHLDWNKKDDIICNGRWKVSGSAAKLLKESSYHHFTLLLNADMKNLQQLLTPKFDILESKATASTPSEVINLRSIDSTINYIDVSRLVASNFYDAHNMDADGQVIDVDPTSETTFPGIMEMRRQLQEWQWIYGKTPKFTVQKKQSFTFGDVVLIVVIQHGIIQHTRVESNYSLDGLSIVCKTLEGLRFCSTDITAALGQSIFCTNKQLQSVCQWIQETLC